MRVVDNPGLAGIMALDSTGGGGRQARVKPPVVCFRSDFHEPEAAPVVYDLELMGAVAEAAGFADGSAPSSLLVFEKIGYQHASRYFSLFENDRGEIEAGATISCLYRCVLFDRDLQVILMRCIGRFELRFKAAYSYILAARRGSRKFDRNGEVWEGEVVAAHDPDAEPRPFSSREDLAALLAA